MDASYQVFFLLAIGTAGMLLLAATIILFVLFYQKKMAQEQLRRQKLEADYQEKMMMAQVISQEKERSRVSKDLHDGVGVMLQVLSNTVMTVATGASPEDKKEIQHYVNEITETVRRISFDLMPAGLEKFGLAKTVGELCSRLSKRGTIPVTFNQSGIQLSLDQNTELLVYRIIQESVNNALRHAQASEIKILFTRNEQHIKVSISDNGIGFDFPTPEKGLTHVTGLGLSSLQNRANLLGATLSFEKNIPSGTQVELTLPAL